VNVAMRELANLMEPVALRLLGEPNRALSKGREWRFGTKGSLSVDIGKGTYFDHESDEGGGVLDLIRREGHPDPLAWLRAERLIDDAHVTQVRFDYRDECGTLLFQVCRSSDKKFKQRRPDGNGGWLYKLDGVRRVPYRLPDLLAGSQAEPVFIPEGEKHVDKLIELGLRATTNPGGAGKWLPDYGAHLAGADVVILPDNDAPGERHAEQVAASLSGTARRVRVLRLPDLPSKGDVIDWFQAGGTKERLMQLAGEAPDWQADGKNGLILTSAAFVDQFIPPDYLIDGLLQRRYLYSLTAPTGAEKTCVALRVAAHVARGLSLGGRTVERGRALIFAGENPDDVRARWIKLCEELGQAPSTMDVCFLAGAQDITTEEGYARLAVEAKQLGPFSLLVVDTSAAYFRGEDENSNTQLGNHARRLRAFTEFPGGPSVLVTCHPTKTPNMENLLPRGGGAFLAEVDGNLVLQKSGSVVDLYWHGKFRGPDFEPIAFKLQRGQSERLKDSKGWLIWTVTAAPITEAERSGIVDRFRADQDEVLSLIKSQPDLSLAQMAERIGWRYGNGKPAKSRVQRAVESLLAAKLIERRGATLSLTPAGKRVARNWMPAQAELEIDGA
jgi:hypothetical protein